MGQHSPHHPDRYSSRSDAERVDKGARVNRRRFIGLGAAGGAVAAAAALGISDAVSGSHPATGHPADHRVPPSSAPDKVSTTRLSDGVTLPTSAAIVAENTKPGAAWWVTTPQNAGDIEGYASQASAVGGDHVTLFVNTKAAQFHVEAYRMGYYQGIGARKVWQSAELAGARQAPPALIASTNTIECGWTPSLTVTVDHSWPPGVYLLKLVGTSGEQQFVPLCVRDDASRAAIVIQQSVTTWQAYNRWGGYSLYDGNRDGALSYLHAPTDSTYEDRAR
ncbi:MAG: N,N-dimethylformamidase beta subunit family domain-containing protein, partial [Acidimicrobiales bacterium]